MKRGRLTGELRLKVYGRSYRRRKDYQEEGGLVVGVEDQRILGGEWRRGRDYYGGGLASDVEDRRIQEGYWRRRRGYHGGLVYK